MTKLKPSKVRRVKIVDPRFVRRVGYPLEVDSLRGPAEQTLINADILKPFEGEHSSLIRPKTRPAHENKLIGDMARFLLVKAGWGGNTRSIHFKELPEYAGRVMDVCGWRMAYTGTRYPPTYYRCGEFGSEYDYEAGGLSDRQSHVIFDVSGSGVFVPSQNKLPHSNPYSTGLWIPANHVEIIEENNGN